MGRCAPSVGIHPFDLIEGFADLIARGYAYTCVYADTPGVNLESMLVSELLPWLDTRAPAGPAR